MSRQGQEVGNTMYHPGIYAADLEQQVLQSHHPPAQFQGSGPVQSNSSFSGASYQYQVPGGYGGGQAYPHMYMPMYAPHAPYSPGMPIQVNPEFMAPAEMGASAFSNDTTHFYNSQGFQRGHGKHNKRGGRQNWSSQNSRRGEKQHFYPNVVPPSYQEDGEYYDEYGYPYQDSTMYGNHRGHRGRGNYVAANVQDKHQNSLERGSYNQNGQQHGNNSRDNNSDSSFYVQSESHSLPLEAHQERNKQSYRSRNNESRNYGGRGNESKSHEDRSYKGKSRDQKKRSEGANRQPSTRGSNAGLGNQNSHPHYAEESTSLQYYSSQVPSRSNSKAGERGDDGSSRVGGRYSENISHRDGIDRDQPNRSNTRINRNLGSVSSNSKGFDSSGSHSKNGKASASGFKSTQKNAKNDVKQTDESQRGTLTEQLSSNKYECMVCCDYVLVEEAVWSCLNCYHVFHLACIKKWALSSMCKETRVWRCPGCQNESSYTPSQYRCFCGSRKNPRYIRGETPHSCGEPCRRKRSGDCKHPCTLLCHPGPCPPCSSMIFITCDCGKVRKSVRCSARSQFKCDQVCDKILNCGEHRCVLQCHSGACPPCAESKSQKCYCLKTKRTVICGTNEFSMLSFSCEKPCGKTLTCGNHVCEEPCHPGECAPCGLTPENLHSCCCGKTKLEDLDFPPRESCLDPVPTCGQVCDKIMPCGSALQPHLCAKKCHDGECGPCSKETTLKCECGATEKKMPCEVAVSFNETNPYKCQKRCGKKKTCGRHKCSDTCCVKDIHICEIVCGQKLSCGIHKCEELCHRGNCKRCLQASFDELTCYCGAEVLEPPVPCGTRRPECHLPCTRQHECDHEVRHQCHAEVKCPPCTELTEKMCMGGHVLRKNIPCYLGDVSCGYPCKKELPCKQHVCPKKCHKGDCLDSGVTCVQPCRKLRAACGHPCGAPCHTGDCPDTACKTEVTITCPCGNRSTKAHCQAGGDVQSSIAQFQRLSVQSMMESDGQPIDMGQFMQLKKTNKRLDCDTNCAIIERNKRLALALEIKNPDMSAKLGTPTFSEFLVDFARKNPKFASGVEKNLSNLVQSVKQSGQVSKSHAFQSMNREQRHFVHELAESYGCQTQSYDYEPNKNVVATAYREKCWLPNVTLLNHAVKVDAAKKPTSRMGVSFTALKKETEEAEVKPNTSRAWETASRPRTSTTASTVGAWGVTSAASTTGRAWGATSATPVAAAPKPAAPVIDYFDFNE